MNNVESFKAYLKLRYQAKLNPHNTGNKIMDSIHFCNIKREWDKVSKYIIDKCINNDSLSINDKIKNIFVARIYNRVETLEGIGYPKVKYNIKEDDLIYKQNPHAYRVQKFLERLCREYNYTGSVWEVSNYIDLIFSEIDNYKWGVSFEQTFNNLCDMLELSKISFIAYQLALDMDYLFHYKDIDDFVILGPGAIRGLNMIYYSDKFSGANKEEYTQQLKGVDYHQLIKQLQKDIEGCIEGVHIHINDLEFNLCEYCKFHSLSNGIKTTQRRF